MMVHFEWQGGWVGGYVIADGVVHYAGVGVRFDERCSSREVGREMLRLFLV